MRVTLRSGSVVESIVVAVEAEALVTDDGRQFLYADVARIERTGISKVKTIALVAGVFVIWFLLEMGAGFSSLTGSGLGGG